MSAPVVVDVEALGRAEEDEPVPSAVVPAADGQARPRLPVVRVVGLVGSAAFAGAMSLTCFVC